MTHILELWSFLMDSHAVRVHKLLQAMNDTMFPYVGAVTGNARSGIPELRLNDGSEGFRDGTLKPGESDSTTQMP